MEIGCSGSWKIAELIHLFLNKPMRAVGPRLSGNFLLLCSQLAVSVAHSWANKKLSQNLNKHAGILLLLLK